MNLLLGLYHRFERFRCAWHRHWFLLMEKPRHQKIDLGQGVTFFVPVRAMGLGTLKVGNETEFGFPLAHRLGTGEIMLQTRTPDAEIIIGKNNLFRLRSSLVTDRCGYVPRSRLA